MCLSKCQDKARLNIFSQVKVLAQHKELENKLLSLLQWVKETSESLDCEETNDSGLESTLQSPIDHIEVIPVKQVSCFQHGQQCLK